MRVRELEERQDQSITRAMLSISITRITGCSSDSRLLGDLISFVARTRKMYFHRYNFQVFFLKPKLIFG